VEVARSYLRHRRFLSWATHGSALLRATPRGQTPSRYCRPVLVGGHRGVRRRPRRAGRHPNGSSSLRNLPSQRQRGCSDLTLLPHGSILGAARAVRSPRAGLPGDQVNIGFFGQRRMTTHETFQAPTAPRDGRRPWYLARTQGGLFAAAAGVVRRASTSGSAAERRPVWRVR
jgi:hypothetical protein